MALSLKGMKKKKEQSEATEEVVAEEENKPVRKAKKPAEYLSTVVSESTSQGAIDVLKGNPNYALPDDQSWIMLGLDVDSIGGLGKKHSNNEAKGSIIELIESDQIQTVVTGEMLDEEFLGIIPNETTLDRMSEYSLLTEAGYSWVRVAEGSSSNSLQVDPVDSDSFGKVDYKTALNIARGSVSLANEIPSVWAEYGGEDDMDEETSDQETSDSPEGSEESENADAADDASEDQDVDDQSQDSSPQALDLSDEDAPDLGAEPQDIDYEAMASGDEPDDSLMDDEPASSAPVAFDANPDAEEQAYEPDSYQEYVETNRDREVTEDEVRDTIARRFLSSELNLEVDTAEFEKVFNTSAPTITIDLDEQSTDWLGNKLRTMADSANAELRRLHADNINAMRESFVGAMSIHSEETMKYVSMEGDTKYAQLKDEIDLQQAKAESEMEKQRSARIQEITKEFNDAAEEAAMAAATQARHRFNQRHEAANQRRRDEVQKEIAAENQEAHAQRMSDLLTMRSSAASSFMSIGATRILSSLADQHEANRAAEQELMREWNAKILEFLDDNRKNDIARADTLAEQLERDNSIEALRSEHAAEIERMRVDQQVALEKAQSDLEKVQQATNAELDRREVDHRHALEVEQAKTRASEERAESLADQLTQLEPTIREQFQDQVEALKAQNMSFQDNASHVNEMQTKNNLMTMLLVVAVGLMGIVAGALLVWLFV